MLMRFNVKNFLSFKDMQEFSMFAGRVRSKKERVIVDDHLKLLKFAALFGANASGKSNFMKAIDFAKDMIAIGIKRTEHYNYWFKLDEECKNERSYFEFEIMINDKYYSYGFEMLLDKKIFTSEWLLELYPNGDNKVIFERDIKEKSIVTELKINNQDLKNKFEVYADDIRTKETTLFINELNRNKSDLLRNDPDLKVFDEVFRWFTFSLDINHPSNSISDYSYFETTEKEYILDVIKSFSTGITNFSIVEESLDELRRKISEKLFIDLEERIEERIKEVIMNNNYTLRGTMIVKSSDSFFIINIDKDREVKVTTLEFEHGKKGKSFSFSVTEESDGTRRIIELIQILLSDENRVFIIDEIDRSLHPQLTYKYIENYLKIATMKNIQLIITTHESRLLDFGLLRQDEVWLVDKNKQGESKLYSLDEYNVRFDQKIDKAYLEGRYGGVPVFSTIFPLKEE